MTYLDHLKANSRSLLFSGLEHTKAVTKVIIVELIVIIASIKEVIVARLVKAAFDNLMVLEIVFREKVGSRAA